MKRIKDALWLAGVLFLASGCEFQDIPELGSRCVGYTYIADVGEHQIEALCFRDEIGRENQDVKCKSYDGLFEFKAYCPKTHKLCMDSLEYGVGCTNACPKGYHADLRADNSGYECVADTVEACGANKVDCTETVQGWLEGQCIKGKCVVEECRDVYAKDRKTGRCLTQNQQCGIFEYDCQKSNLMCVISVNSVEGICRDGCGDLEMCSAIGEDICVDIHTSASFCGNCNTRCKTHEECNSGKCSCKEGYEFCEDTGCVDLGKDLKHCGNCENNCTQISGWSKGDCANGRCQTLECQRYYHVRDNICIRDSVEECGPSLLNCNQPGWEEAWCENGQCYAKSCSNGLVLYNNQCGEQCGEVSACTTRYIEYSTEVVCEDDICKAKSCNSGYTSIGTICCQNVRNAQFTADATSCSNYVCNGGYTDNGKTCCEDIPHGTIAHDSSNVCSFTCNTEGENVYIKNEDESGCILFVCDEGQTRCAGESGLDFQVCHGNAWETTPCRAVQFSSATCTPESGCGFECQDGYASNLGTCCKTIANGSIVQDGNSSQCNYQCNDGYILSEDGTQCEQNNCNNGDTRCTNSAEGRYGKFQVCRSHSWSDTGEGCQRENVSCDMTKSSPTCGECLDGNIKCEAGNEYQCEGGNWKVSKSCNGKSCTVEGTNGICGDCLNGSEKCENDLSGLGTHSTCYSGVWRDSLCSGSSCDTSTNTCGVCINESTKCENVSGIGKVYSCNGGKWSANPADCSNVSCDSSKTRCGSCRDGSARCYGSTASYQICTNGTYDGVATIDCPASANSKPSCNNGQCATICNNGYCESEGGCTSNQTDLNNCGVCGNKCSQSDPKGTSFSCDAGVCHSLTCQSGYIVIDGKCVLKNCEPGENKCINDGDTGYSSRCENNAWTPLEVCPNASTCQNSNYCGICKRGSKRCSGGTTLQVCRDNGTWDDGTHCEPPANGLEMVCLEGSCVLTSCENGFFVHNGICKANTNDHCGSMDHACRVQGNVSTFVTQVACNTDTGECEITECVSGYHISRDKTQCEEDTETDCGSMGNSCANKPRPNNSTAKCINGQCSYKCDDNFCDVSGNCVSNDTNHCFGASCGACHVSNSSSNICENGVCKATGCSGNFHVSDGGCEPHSNENCGIHGVSCTTDKKPGSLTVNCDTGTCKATACNTGTHHLYQDDCEAHSVENCGLHGRSCTKDNSAGLSCSDGTCKATSCNGGYHLWDNGCEQNTNQNCGKHGQSCTTANVDHSSEVNCSSAGECRATRCESGYYESDGKCYQGDMNNCGGTGIKCEPSKVANSLTVICSNNECIANTCKSNFHIYGKTCEADSTSHCGEHGHECKKSDFTGSATVDCINARCVATTCNSGFHLYAAEGICEANSNTHCGAHNSPCALSNIPGSTSVDCSSGSCKATACNGTSHHLYGATCEQNDGTNCGTHGNPCNLSTIAGSTSVSCSTGSCVATACNNTSHHLYNNNCEPNDGTNCGTHGTPCNLSTIPGSTAVSCSTGTCKATACTSGTYHQYNDICEANDNNNCGAHNAGCSKNNFSNATGASCVSGVCTISSCSSGYHVYAAENTCERNDITNCGEHGVTCSKPHSTSVSCATGTCIATACESPGYHKYDNGCEKNDTTNCGAHGTPCSLSTIQYSTGVECSTGTCKATGCDGSHFLNSGLCIDSDMNNCGGSGVVCNTTKVDNSATVTCESNTCVATSCNTGYHVYNGGCEKDNNSHCGEHGVTCTTAKVTGSTAVNCPEGICIATGCNTSQYHLYQGICEPHSNLNCNAHGTTCTLSNIPGSTNVDCTSGSCIATSCNNTTHHFYNNSCEINNNSHCGDHTSTCSLSNIPGSTNVSCSTGTCIATACNNTSHHLYNNNCELNDAENCGIHGEPCTLTNQWGATAVSCSTGTCLATSCETPQFHLYNGTCEANDNTHCGSHTGTCTLSQKPGSTAVDCSTGICKATACSSTYHLNGNDCELNTNEHCGGHNVPCQCSVTGCTSTSCTYGVCTITGCDNNHVLSNGTCVSRVCNAGETQCQNNASGVGEIYTCINNAWTQTSTCTSSNSCAGTGGVVGQGCGTCHNGISVCEVYAGGNDSTDNCVNGVLLADICETTVPHAYGACASDTSCGDYKCQSGYTKGCVANACINYSNDPNHCGNCSTSCGTSHVTSRSCVSGQCKLTCDYGYVQVGNQCVISTCSNNDYAYVSINNQNVMALCLWDEAGFKKLRQAVNAGESYPSAFILADDIEIKDEKWTEGIGTKDNTFKNVLFEGNYKTITIRNAYSGLFDHVDKSYFTNMVLMTNITKSGSGYSYIGGLINYSNQNVIEEVIVGASYIVTDTNYTGGLVGYSYGDNIRAITVTGMNITALGKTYVGGVAGAIMGSEFDHCDAAVRIRTLDATDVSLVGGFAGRIDDARLINCSVGPIPKTGYPIINIDNPTATSIGGFVGYAVNSTDKSELLFGGCSVTGELSFNSTQTDKVGGFVGSSEKYDYDYCLSETEINIIDKTKANQIGGFAGTADNGLFRRSQSTGSIEFKSTSGSSIGGFMGSSSSVTYDKCLAISKSPLNVTKASNAGGFVGTSSGDTISKCGSIMNVNASNAAGGFAGVCSNKGSFSENFALSHVNGNKNVGGFAGYATGIEFSDSYQLGNVTGSANFGGFIGYATDNTYKRTYFYDKACDHGMSVGNNTGSNPAGMTRLGVSVNASVVEVIPLISSGYTMTNCSLSWFKLNSLSDYKLSILTLLLSDSFFVLDKYCY